MRAYPGRPRAQSPLPRALIRACAPRPPIAIGMVQSPLPLPSQLREDPVSRTTAMFVLAVPFFAAVAHAEDSIPAQQLFERMEAKLLQAKSLRVESDCEGSGGNMEARISVSLWAGEGNRVRVEHRDIEADGDRVTTLVCDGTSMCRVEHGKQMPAAETLKTNVVAAAARIGLWVDLHEKLFRGKAPEGTDLRKDIQLTDFAMGDEEQIGERRVQVVRYRATIELREWTFDMQVWIDCETGLPAKREGVFEDRGTRYKVAETYKEVQIDTQIDSTKFELPK